MVPVLLLSLSLLSVIPPQFFADQLPLRGSADLQHRHPPKELSPFQSERHCPDAQFIHDYGTGLISVLGHLAGPDGAH